MKECSRYRSEAGARDEKPSPLRGGRFVRGDEANQSAGRSLSTLYWLAPIPDVVDNHAGCDFGEQIMYFFDRLSTAGAVCVQPFGCAHAASQASWPLPAEMNPALNPWF